MMDLKFWLGEQGLTVRELAAELACRSRQCKIGFFVAWCRRRRTSGNLTISCRVGTTGLSTPLTATPAVGYASFAMKCGSLRIP